ncbi:MAG: C1 family peptidase [Ignavibacteriales bacterium]|nr:C1 family peptidase [Ignavibacteriales bacterium]
MKKTIPILLLILTSIVAQDRGMGLLLDEALYKNAPRAAKLMRGDYENLPNSVSLKQYTPTPSDQGPYSTCAGWASSYYARTILEAMKQGWNKQTIDKNTFSPSFIYNQIRKSDDCYGGTSLDEALDILKNVGDVKFSDFGYNCKKEVNDEDRKTANDYKIIEYRFLAYKDTVNIIKYVKKSLAEGKPVVIGIECPPSFASVKGELWTPAPSEYKSWKERGHALTIISYDNNKFGGALEIINSWGKNWGNNGYAWMKYSDFKIFYMLAYEVIDKRNIDSNAVDLSGSLQFMESNGKEMKSKFNGQYFVMEEPYYSGSLFELRITNNEPAYVYAFSSDLTYKTYKIFPNAERVLAYLPYRQNNVAIPDEDTWNLLDTTRGKTYYCFLYSKESLEIENILKRIENEKGLFWERLNKVLKSSFVDVGNIEFKYDREIKFSARSKGKTVVPVLVEIEHL